MKKKNCVLNVLLLMTVFLLFPATAVQAKAKIKLSVKKKTVYLQIGKSVSLGAKASNKAKLTYSSAKPSVVKVTKKGKIKALTPGKAKVTVKAKKKGYKTASLKVTVYAVTPQEMQGTMDDVLYVTMEKGAVYQSPLSANTAISYKSSDPSVVKVLSGGKLKALKTGTCSVTVKAKASKSWASAVKEIDITVKKKGSVKDGISYDGGWSNVFLYKYNGATYHCGELPLAVEKKLAAKYVPFMNTFLNTYVPKEEAVCADHTLAVLAAIHDTFVQYNLKYDSTPASSWFTYDSSNVDRDEWYSIATKHGGLCEDFASLFSYMCYLEGLDCWSVGNGDKSHSGHKENMLFYKGYAYIIEPQDFMHSYEEASRHFYYPVIGKPTKPSGAKNYTSAFRHKAEYKDVATEAAFQKIFPLKAVTGTTPVIALVEHGEVFGASSAVHFLTFSYQFYLDCEKGGDGYEDIYDYYTHRAYELGF